MKIDVIILAAGIGSRMRSSRPKVMHFLAGRPLLEHVVQTTKKALQQLEDSDSKCSGNIHIVLGHGADKVKHHMRHHELNFINQEEQLGTGHAVMQALPACKGSDIILILYGDVPLIKPSTLQAMINLCQGRNLALLTADMPDPTGYGRIVRNQEGRITEIVEHRDACAEQLAIREINTGIMAIPGAHLEKWISSLTCDNSQNEYYLTDIVSKAIEGGVAVVNSHPKAIMEIMGVNTRAQLAKLERMYQKEQCQIILENGGTLLDPQRVDIRGNLITGQDIVIDINCIFEGDVQIGNNVHIQAGCIIQNSKIGDNTVIKPYSLVEDSVVENNCSIGPFARLRPGSHILSRARIGNFVETKKAEIGSGSKVNHLSYIGNARIGENCNLGAGTITCNYDGIEKHETTIESDAFIGSNTALVAPITIGEKAVVGAGSVITESVPAESLAIERSQQKNLKDWHKRKNK